MGFTSDELQDSGFLFAVGVVREGVEFFYVVKLVLE